jgi:hypothetical protein
VGDITKVTAIAAGYNHSFASRHDGHLPPLVQNRGRSGKPLRTLPTDRNTGLLRWPPNYAAAWCASDWCCGFSAWSGGAVDSAPNPESFAAFLGCLAAELEHGAAFAPLDCNSSVGCVLCGP